MGWSCARCAGSNPDGTKFCGHCGTARALTEAEGRATELATVIDERREVTSVFADISGFTTLADQLEPEELHSIISPVINGLAAIAERYEGYLVKYAGDALLFFFGAPIAHEDDPERALLVALEMHAALPALVEELRTEAGDLQLHVGVTTGSVVSGHFGGDSRADYSILGDAVNVAQRLESVAPGGETYVSETTYRLTSSRFAFEFVGDLALKGKLKPVAAYRLLGRQTAPALTPTRLHRLVGRANELSAIRPLLDPSTYGAAVVAVVGDPGIGKSRLLQQVRDDVQDRDGRWFDTRCLSYGAALPYWPIVDLVRRLLGVAPDDRAEVAGRRLASSPKVTDEHRPFLARLLGATGETAEADRLDPEAFRRHLHDAVTSLLISMGGGRSVTIAIEDVHWADASTLALLKDLIAAGLRLYVTTRPEGRAAAEALAAAAPAGRAVTIELRPLTPPAVGELLSAVLEGDVPVDLVATVAARTDGNPLFVEEIARALRERGAIERRHDRWRLADPTAVDELPDSVERVLASRIDLLPPRAAAVLQVASVVGRLVRFPLLKAAAEEVVDVDEALAQLVEHGFLDVSLDGDEQVLAFHHALVQQVAYERLLRRQREEMHLRVARAATALYGDGDDVVDLLARHLFLGGAGAEAVDPLTRAGERAANLFATEEAIVHLSRAIDVLAEADDDARLRKIQLELAELHAVRGDYETAEALFEAVRVDTGALEAWRGEASVRWKQGDYAGALDVIDLAFSQIAPDTPGIAGLWLERARSCAATGRFDEAKAALAAGLAVVDSADDDVHGWLYTQLAHVHAVTGGADAARDAALAARGVFERGDHLRSLVSAERVLGHALAVVGDLDGAATAFTSALSLAERTGTIEELAGLLLNLGMVHLARGDLESAIDCDRRAIAEFERLDHGNGQAVGYGNLAEKVLMAGQPQDAVRWCERALTKAAAIGHTGTIADAGRTLARALLELGRVEDAKKAATEAAAAFRSLGDDAGATECERIAAGDSLVG